MRRRTLLGLGGLSLVGVAAVPLSGCTSGTNPSPTDTSTAGPTDPVDPTADVDIALREGVAREEGDLIARYEATITAHPALADRLRPLAAQHREHRAALRGDAADTDDQTISPPAVSADAATALADLAAQERAAADSRTTACVDASGHTTARLLALIAASEASHAEALGGVTA